MFNNNYTGKPTRWLVWSYPLDWSAKANVWTDGSPSNMLWVKTDKGYQNQCWSFNWSSSYVTITNNNEISDSDFSVSLWTKPSPSTKGTIFMFWTRDVSISYWQWMNNRIRFNIYNAWDNSIDYDFVTVWRIVHICVTRSKTSWMIMYINWVSVLTKSYTWNWWTISWTASLWRDSRWTGFFNWLIQNVDIYNVVLTEDEIRNLYLEWQRQLGAYSSPSYPSLLSWLVWYYDFRWDASNLVDWVKWTVNGATLTTDRFGNSNSAYSFDWTTQNIQIPDSNDFSPITTWVLSFFAWVRTTNVSWIGYKIIWSKYTSWTSSTSEWFLSASNTNQLVISGNGTNAVAVNQTITDWNWHLVWCCIKATWAKIYYEWNTIVSWNLTLWNNTNTVTRIWYFASSWASNEWWNWQIWDCFFFNRELSANEVKALYELTSKDYIYPSKIYYLPNLRDWLVLEYNWSNNWTTTLYDTSWNRNNGTMVNSPTISRIGQHKQIGLNGSNQYVTCSYSPNITSPITFSFWYKTSANYSTTSWIITWKFNWWNNYWIWLNTSNLLTFYVWWSSNWQLSDNWVTNDWKRHQVVAVYDWTNIKLYRDWVLKWTLASWTCSPTWNLRIWTFWDVLWYYFNWNIKDSIIYNRALSANEVQQLYYSTYIN